MEEEELKKIDDDDKEEEEEKKIDDDDKEEEGPAGYLCIRRAGCQQDRPRPGGREGSLPTVQLRLVLH